jgi:hypothetical protein
LYTFFPLRGVKINGDGLDVTWKEDDTGED